MFNKNIQKLFFNILPLFIFGFTYAQKSPVKFGVKAGWNYSNVHAIDENGESSGYLSDGGEVYGGLTLEKQILEKSYIQANLLVSFTDRVTFLELPIYYKYNFYNRFSFIIGPKLNYIPDSEESQPYNFERRLGISGDLGIDYKISKHFIVEGTFSKGFTKQYSDLVLTYYHARRNVYRIGISYYF